MVTVVLFVAVLLPYLVLGLCGPTRSHSMLPVLPLVAVPLLTSCVISLRLLLLFAQEIRFKRLTEEPRAAWRPTTLTMLGELHDGDFWLPSSCRQWPAL
jgi:hypothetical protein